MSVSFPLPTRSSSASKANRKTTSSSRAITSEHRSIVGIPSSQVEIKQFRSAYPPILKIGQYLLPCHCDYADYTGYQSTWTPNCLVSSDCSSWDFHATRRLNIIDSGYEDYQRYASDKRLNHDLKTQVLRDGGFVEVEWS